MVEIVNKMGGSYVVIIQHHQEMSVLVTLPTIVKIISTNLNLMSHATNYFQIPINLCISDCFRDLVAICY